MQNSKYIFLNFLGAAVRHQVEGDAHACVAVGELSMYTRIGTKSTHNTVDDM
jgi:hypothetical protein